MALNVTNTFVAGNLIKSSEVNTNFNDVGDYFDGNNLNWDTAWNDAVHDHSSDAEGGLLPYLLMYYGDGSDGNSTISSDTDLSETIKFYNNLTINDSVTLTTKNSIIYVKGTLTNNGIINNGYLADSNGSGGTIDRNGGDGGSGGKSSGRCIIFARHVTGNGSIVCNGENGASGEDGKIDDSLWSGLNGSNGESGASGVYLDNTTSASSGGGGGTYTGSIGPGGTAGSPTLPLEYKKSLLQYFITINQVACGGAGGGSGAWEDPTTMNTGGGGGAGGSLLTTGGNGGDGGSGGGQTGESTSGGAGGGGGAGGIIVLITMNNTSTITISATGGNGGDGGDGYDLHGAGGGGGGGAGGVVITISDTVFSTASVTGGSGGNKGSTAGVGPAEDGSAGSAGITYHKTWSDLQT